MEGSQSSPLTPSLAKGTRVQRGFSPGPSVVSQGLQCSPPMLWGSALVGMGSCENLID